METQQEVETECVSSLETAHGTPLSPPRPDVALSARAGPDEAMKPMLVLHFLYGGGSKA